MMLDDWYRKLEIQKRGFTQSWSEEFMAAHEGFERKGHYIEKPITDAQRLQHYCARVAVTEVEENPYIEITDDGEVILLDLEPEREFVPEETPEEWLARWRANES